MGGKHKGEKQYSLSSVVVFNLLRVPTLTPCITPEAPGIQGRRVDSSGCGKQNKTALSRAWTGHTQGAGIGEISWLVEMLPSQPEYLEIIIYKPLFPSVIFTFN